MLGLLAHGIRGFEKRNENVAFERDGNGSGFEAGAHGINIVVVTITVKRKTDGLALRLAHRPQMDFTQKTLRALADDHGDGMGDIVRGKHFGRVLGAAPGKFGGDAAGTDYADADAVFAQIFGHAAGKALQTPF